jgi:hypothetical protein
LEKLARLWRPGFQFKKIAPQTESAELKIMSDKEETVEKKPGGGGPHDASAQQAPSGPQDAPAKASDNASGESTELTESGEDLLNFEIKRKSRWITTLLALQYVTSISKDNYVRLRVSDRVTSIALLLAVILAVSSLVFRPLADVRTPLALLCDALVGAMLLFYMANRLGVLTTLPPRQALLAWELILVSCIVGIFLTVNFFIFVAMMVSSMSLPIAH